MRRHERLQLPFQTVAKQICMNSEVQIGAFFRTEHLIHPLLNARILIFQREVKNGALCDGLIPKRYSACNAKRELRCKKTLADFSVADQKIHAGEEQI